MSRGKARAARGRSRGAWKPMTFSGPVTMVRIPAHAGGTEPGAAAGNLEQWLNDKYVVIVRRYPDGPVMHLSVRRDDRNAVRARRDLQHIKNDIAGTGTEALELFPADARLVDTSNQYHLWCLRPGERLPMPPGCQDLRDSPAARDANADGPEVRRYDKYVVIVRRYPDGPVMHLSVRRGNGSDVRDWRDLQHIKNDITGTGAFELFPAGTRPGGRPGRYDLWCLRPGERLPFGFTDRYVLAGAYLPDIGARQRSHGQGPRPMPAQQPVPAVPAGWRAPARGMPAGAEARRRSCPAPSGGAASPAAER